MDKNRICSYLNGWLGYYDFTERPEELNSLESWLQRRLRSLIWVQWKTRKKRLKALRARGIHGDLAKKTAASTKGPWRISRSRALHIALPKAYFRQLGLPPLTARGVA
jgi:RNA-directed DNA polymerase